MQATPTKKQATAHNAILTHTPERRAGDQRGQMASYTPEDLKAQLASRPRSVRSSVSQGYAVSPRAALTSHRSEPSIMPGYSLAASPSPSPSRPLMAMCETFTSSNPSSPPSITSLSYHNSTQSILARANQSYLLNWSPSTGSSISSIGQSPRKRGQMDDEEAENNDSLGRVGAKAYNDTMDHDTEGDETMMVEDDDDLPLSRSASTRQIPPLSFSNSGSATSSASSSATSSDMFFAPFPSPSTQQQGQGRQLKTIPRRALGKTQSLPADTFMENMATHTQPLVRDVFNATDGF